MHTLQKNITIPATTSQDHDLVEVNHIDPTIKLDIRYATENNFTGKQVYPSSRCFLRRIAAEKLHNIQNELRTQGLGLKIFDGYRPFYVQEIFWKICPDEHYVGKPVRGTDGSLVDGSMHNRGLAVDISLIDLATGQELEMPSGYDDFSNKAHRTYKTMTKAAAHNCKLLEDIMVKYGFESAPSEWWHFELADLKTFDLLDIDFDQIK